MKAKLFLLALPAALALGTLAMAGDVQQFCVPANLNSTGRPATLTCTGTGTIHLNDTCLNVTNVPRGSAGLFFFSDTPRRPLPFGAGNLCIGGNVHRLPAVVADPYNSAHLPDLVRQPEARVIQAGTTWYFQYLFWDHGAGNRNLSNGLQIDFTQ